MGFDYNPFNHIELVRAPIPGSTDPASDGGWIWLCHGCGADSYRGNSWREPLVSDDLLALLVDWRQHLQRSHSVIPEDFAGWSDY